MVLVVVPVVCGGAGCTGGAAEHAAPTALPRSDVNPMPRDRLRDGGTLRWALPEFPAQWNFHHVDGKTGAAARVLQGALPYLMRADEKGVVHRVPEYLRSAEVERTGRGQTVVYRLNPKAKWSDGRAIGYRDFAVQARALSGRDSRYEIADDTGYRRIERVERGADEHVVKVVFARPYADWRRLFSPLYPAAAYADPRAFNRGWLDRPPVTAGPFTVGDVDRTAETITLVRDPGWWGRRARLDRIVYRAMDQAAMPGAFANGEIDLVEVGLDAGALRRVERAAGARVRRAAGPDRRLLTFNAAGPILADERVRRAVTLGIEREAIARSDLVGLGVPVRTLGNHFYVNTQQGYRDNSGAFGRHDPVRAARLLEEAGWTKRGRYRAKDGRTLALRFVVAAGQPIGKREGELVRALLERVGVRVDIEPVPTEDLFGRYVTKGNFDIVPFSWLGTPFPVSSMRAVYARPHEGRVRQNYSGGGTVAIDSALERAVTAKGSEVHVLVNRADRLVWQEALVLPLYQRPQLVAARADLANIGACGFHQPAYEDIGFAQDAPDDDG
ncbi:ABC transporter family substrate-binding protein [Actinomadura algeriensis]|uniref:Peptide/nickel transport system substrate-binding protein n=1 Tax=Actinomadura algeriensis TaxID=1679523 RepID=A0ABR9JWM1_9ACTN|nr:ABC transporter family substrate-binding protein [Actinomadura algeriensis]MBE1534955.1 peptide/nickel transport system substrate-binding protein [Actinomadura algeriensis]